MKNTAKKSAVPTNASDAKPVFQAWRNPTTKPWISFCDVRAVVAMVVHLHEVDRCPWFSLKDLIRSASEADYGCLPYLRRADIGEAFSDLRDLKDSLSINIGYLVEEKVLLVKESDRGMYRIDYRQLRVLDGFHADIHRKVAKSTGLHVVP